MLRHLPSARIAYAVLLQAYRPLQKSHDHADLLEKLRLRRKLRPALQRLTN